MKNAMKRGLALAAVAAWALPGMGSAQHDHGAGRAAWAPASMGYQLGIVSGIAPEDDAGVRVAAVDSGGPADEAGIRMGDVVVSVAGHVLAEPLDDAAEDAFHDGRSLASQRLRAVLRDLHLEEGESIEVRVRRGDDELAFDVVPQKPFFHGLANRLAEIRVHLQDARTVEPYVTAWALRDSALKAQELALLHFDTLVADRINAQELALLRFDTLVADLDGWSYFGHGVHGLDLVEVNPDLGAYFGTSSGVLVAEVDEDSSTGLRAGDVVVSVDGRQVADIAKLRRILRSYESEEQIRFGIWRNGAETTVAGTLN